MQTLQNTSELVPADLKTTNPSYILATFHKFPLQLDLYNARSMICIKIQLPNMTL